MNRRLFLAALLLLAAAGTRAAEPRRALRQGQILRGRFIQERRLQGFNAPLRSEGTFVLAPGRGLIWRAETPFAVTTIITAAGLVQDASGTETMRLTTARAPFMARLYDMLAGALGGDMHALENDFTVGITTEGDHWRYDLRPRTIGDAMMPFQSMVVRGSALVEQVDMLKPGGDSDTLTFLDQAVSNAPLTAGEAAALAR